MSPIIIQYLSQLTTEIIIKNYLLFCNILHTSLVVPGDPDRLGTPIYVGILETL